MKYLAPAIPLFCAIAFAASVSFAKPAPKVSEIPLINVENEAINTADIAFVTGGVGEDERAEIEAAKADYTLYVTSAKKTGEFVEDTKIVIRLRGDSTGEPLLAVEAGPLLYVALANGSYELEATYNGVTQKKVVVLNKKRPTREVSFNWDKPLAEKK